VKVVAAIAVVDTAFVSVSSAGGTAGAAASAAASTVASAPASRGRLAGGDVEAVAVATGMVNDALFVTVTAFASVSDRAFVADWLAVSAVILVSETEFSGM
jgi:hypothetical protein